MAWAIFFYSVSYSWTHHSKTIVGMQKVCQTTT